MQKGKTHQYNKLIKTLKRIDLPSFLAAAGGGIVTLATVVHLYALSQEQPSSTLNVAPYPYQLNDTTQSPSQAKTTPSSSATVSNTSKLSSTTVANGANTIFNRKIPDDTVANKSKTIPIVSVPSGVTTPDENTSNSVTPNVLTIPVTSPLPDEALTAPDSRFKPDSFTVNSRFSSRLNDTTPKSDTSTIATETWSSPARTPQILTSPNTTTLSRVSTASVSTTTPPKLPSLLGSLKRTSIAVNPSSTENKYMEQAIADANAVAFGLVMAKREGQISPHTTMWRKAQDAIFLLRHGKTRQEAARGSGISLPVLMQLIAWGQNRP